MAINNEYQAAIYLIVPTDGTVNSVMVENLTEDCERICSTPIYKIYREDVPGGNIETTLIELYELQKDARKKKFKFVVFASLDGWSNKMKAINYVTKRLDAFGIFYLKLPSPKTLKISLDRRRLC